MTITFSTLPTALSAGATQPVSFPPQLANNRVIGFDVQNFSSFNFTLVGIPAYASYAFLPYQGMFIPVSYASDIIGIQPLEASAVILIIGSTLWFPSNDSAGADIAGFVQFTAYLEGDDIPTRRLVPYLLPIPQLGPRQFLLRNNVFTVSAALANSTAAHSTALGPAAVSSILSGGGFYLLYLGFQFFSPAAVNVAELVTLTDINGTVILEWDVQVGAAAGVQGVTPVKDLLFPFPGLLTNAVVGGQQNWTLNTPATVNGPAYTVDMYGYAV